MLSGGVAENSNGSSATDSIDATGVQCVRGFKRFILRLCVCVCVYVCVCVVCRRARLIECSAFVYVCILMLEWAIDNFCISVRYFRTVLPTGAAQLPL